MTRRGVAAVLLAALLAGAPLTGCGRAGQGGGAAAGGAAPGAAPSVASARPAAGAAPDSAASRVTTAPAAPEKRIQRLPLPAGRQPFRIASGDVQVFPLPLAKGDHLLVAAEQRGADVILSLRAPDGEELLWVDRPTGAQGLERLPWIARQDGIHELEVRVFELAEDGEAPPLYELEVRHSPDAGPTQRAFLAATRANQRGLLHLEEGAREGAEAAWLEAATGFGELGEVELQAESLDHLAAMYTNSGEPELRRAAMEIWRQVKELYLQLDVGSEVGRAGILEGRLLIEFDRPEEAKRTFVDLIPYLEERRVAPSLAEAHHHLGIALSTLGEGERAIEHLTVAAGLWPPSDEESLAISLRLAGYEYLLMGLPHRAVAKLEEAVRLYRSSGSDPSAQARGMTTLASAYLDLGRLDEAERLLRDAVELRRRQGDRRGEAVTVAFLYEVASLRGDRAAGRGLLERALTILDPVRDEDVAADVERILGWMDVDDGDPLSAQRRFERALPVERRTGTSREEASIRLGLGKALADQGRLEEGLEHVRASLRDVERMRRVATARSLRVHHWARLYYHHDVHVELLMRLHERNPRDGYDRQALAAVEGTRARGLREEFLRRRVSTMDGSEEMRRLGADRQRLLQRLESLERRWAELRWEAAGAAELQEVERRLGDTDLDLQRVEGRMAVRGGADGALEHSLGLEEIQRRVVTPDSLLLYYHLGEERSFLWLVDRGSLRSFELPAGEEIAALARRAHALASSSRRRTRRIPARHALAALSDVVLAPVAEHLGEGHRLLVVPDGALLYVPFAALPLPNREEPLLSEHEIVYLPSASTLADLRARRRSRTASRGVLALVADPVFGPDDPRLDGSPGSKALDRSAAEELPRLEHAALEAESILAVAPPGPTLTATGFDARRDLLLSGALADYRVVHLATHARIHPERPDASALYLSRVDAEGRTQVGAIRSWDLYRLDLPAELVTLSACRTALGQELRGEGLVGFTQGFFAAGASRVVVSLWDVGDESTALLMDRFYRHLFEDGLTPAAALRQAQLSMWREVPWQPPYHWAGFVLQGEPR